jgi:hypothetical protein
MAAFEEVAMLGMTPGQSADLHRAQATHMRDDAARYLSEHYARDLLPPDVDWPMFVKAATRLANRKGLHSELGVITLCELALVHGPAFHSSPWAVEVLDISDADEGEKVARLREHLH